MANNSFVTRDEGEIGRAQAFQAEAYGIDPDVTMNHPPLVYSPSFFLVFP